LSATELVIVSWNLYHGRDAPPDPALGRRLLWPRTLVHGAYAQVNRSLRSEFASLIATADWSICLLQEAPPSWTSLLAGRSGAQAFRTLTSRNQLRPLTALLARWNPDLIGAWEGGSNTTLVRPPWRLVEGSRRSLLLNPLRERRLRERRRMSFTRVRAPAGGGSPELCVANLHASHFSQKQAEREGRRAAEHAVAWAAGAPLVLAGDFNVRPARSRLFAELERDFGLAPVTGPDAIDHVLVRGLEVVEAPSRWEPERRDIEFEGSGKRLKIRLSDHAPVEARLRVPAGECGIT
jgi:endonuclease/exonuclease/phosphatase family metal-dependent hydrolase